jgi:hypothetical protein
LPPGHGCIHLPQITNRHSPISDKKLIIGYWRLVIDNFLVLEARRRTPGNVSAMDEFISRK